MLLLVNKNETDPFCYYSISGLAKPDLDFEGSGVLVKCVSKASMGFSFVVLDIKWGA